jgi:hypothetical protein
MLKCPLSFQASTQPAHTGTIAAGRVLGRAARKLAFRIEVLTDSVKPDLADESTSFRNQHASSFGADDPNLIFFTDDVAEASAYLQRHAVRRFGLRRKKAPRAIHILAEKAL